MLEYTQTCDALLLEVVLNRWDQCYNWIATMWLCFYSPFQRLMQNLLYNSWWRTAIRGGTDGKGKIIAVYAWTYSDMWCLAAGTYVASLGLLFTVNWNNLLLHPTTTWRFQSMPVVWSVLKILFWWVVPYLPTLTYTLVRRLVRLKHNVQAHTLSGSLDLVKFIMKNNCNNKLIK